MTKSLQELFEHFIYEAEFVKRVRPTTLHGYKYTFKTFTRLMPGLSLDLITSETMTHFFKLLQERKRIVGKGIVKTGIKNSTAASYWCKLNAFFSWLSIKGHLNNNPFTKMNYPKPSYENKQYLKKEEIERILTAIHITHGKNMLLFKRNLVIFYLLLYCGLRKEELLLLQVRDIDFERKTVTIRGDTSKSGRTRLIPLHSTTLMHMKDYLSERKDSRTPRLILSTQREHGLSETGLKHLVLKIRRISGIPFHLHQFRHTFAVNFLRATNNIFKLKLLLGHQDINVTMLYLRCLPTNELRGDIETLSIDTFM
jgi:site-specific recombinase XerD